MTREYALELLRKHVRNENMVKHCLASEAVLAALAAGETITGLVIATALVYPDKKLSSVKTKSIVKRMKEKAFARSVNRDIIRECEQIGLELREFAEIALGAMQSVSDVLGL